MVEIKLVINDTKTGKSFQMEVKDDVAKKFMGLKIGQKIKGEIIDLKGYELEIRGGSDLAGFPMRPDLDLVGRKKVLITKGIGFKGIKGFGKGLRKRKAVYGNTIGTSIVQVNLKVVKYGPGKLQTEQAKETPKEETPKEVPKKVEEKPKTEEKPVEEKKEQPKQDKKPEEKKEEKKEDKFIRVSQRS